MSVPLTLRTESNSVIIGGGLSQTEFRRPLAAMHTLVAERGYQDLVLDFTSCEFTHAPPMVALLCGILRYRAHGIDFQLKLPKAPQLERLFFNSNWAHFIEPNRYSPTKAQSTRHNPAKTFGTSEDQGRLVNEVMDTFLASLTDFSRSHLKAIEWSLNEITDNVLVHSQSSIGGLIQVTALRNKKSIEFVVGDAGIGVATSLRSGHGEISSDVDALSKAIQEGVTRDKKIGQGNGLFGTYRIAVQSGGHFAIASDHATLYYAESAGMHSKGEPIPVHGAVITCGINYTNPLLLDEVLRFNNKPHQTVDRVELKYESTADGAVYFKLLDEARSLGSRISGTPVRNKLANLANICATDIVVDFTGVQLISSSFADEVFGKLFLSLGAMAFASRFQFKNLDPTVRKLIDKAIMQRVAVGAND